MVLNNVLVAMPIFQNENNWCAFTEMNKLPNNSFICVSKPMTPGY